LSNVEQLLSKIHTSTVILLDGQQDGISQITETLDQLSQQGIQLSAMHLLAHGSVGALQLGSSQLTADDLSQYTNQLSSWQSALTPDADILLYGCSVGVGDIGQAFLNQLGQIIGADIAASIDITGNAALGGDWDLEVQRGAIEATTLSFEDYSSILPTYNGKEYRLTSAATSWTAALAEAQRLGGNLVTINDAAEQAWLRSTFSTTERLWIGLTDRTTEGSFAWANGETTTYRNWAPGEPNDYKVKFAGGEDYVLMNWNGSGQWNDMPDSFEGPFRGIVEIPSTSPPPTTDTTAPTATLSAPAVTTAGGTTYDFTVTYSDNIAIDVASLDGSDMRVTGPNGFNQLATLVSRSSTTNGTPRTAIYRITAPGGSWDSTDNGTYSFALQANQVRDAAGNVAAARTVGTVSVTIPTTSPSLPTYNGKQYRLTSAASWTAALAEAQRLGGNLVTINDAAEQAWLRSTFSTTERLWIGLTDRTTEGSFAWANGETTTYRNWVPDEPNDYKVNFAGGEDYVLMNWNDSGQWNDMPDSFEGTFRGIVEIPSASPPPTTDTTAPTATLSAPAVTTAGGITYDFTVTYSDNVAIDVSSLDSSDMRVTGPNGFNQLATLVSRSSTTNGTPRTATYRATAPGGTWDTTDNGTYSFALQANQVRDAAGNAAAARTLGTVSVNLPTTTPGGTGLRAEYFNNPDFTDLVLVRTDATVNFDWGLGSPDATIGPDTFAVRWTGQIEARYSQTYTFYTTSDDGVRLWVNGQLLIDAFIDQAETERQGTIALQAGQKYDLRMEYYENGYDAVARLAWSSSSQAREIIPRSQLFAAPAGGILMGLDAPTVRESDGRATVRIERDGGINNYAKVIYTTNDGTAKAGSDYTAIAAGEVTFLPGETSKRVTIPILDDAALESDEDFGVGILDVLGAGLGTRRTTRVTIIDNDSGTPTFNLSQSSYSVGEGDRTAVITVVRSGNPTIPASVRYATSNGTATAGADYTTATGTLSFAANETSKTFAIPITQDAAIEANETINLTLSNPTGGQLGTRSAGVLTILDDDAATRLTPTPVFTGLEDPTTLAFAPASAQYGQLMFIAEKDGRVRVAKDGVLLPDAFIDISAQVNEFRDRGLIGLAVHPEFFTGNPYIYLAYTYDPPETANYTGVAGRDGTGNRPSQVMKVRADVGAGYVRAATGADSREIILGKNSNWLYTSRPDVNATNDFSTPPSGIVNGTTITAPANQIDVGTQDNNLNQPGIQNQNIRDYLATDSETHSIGDLEFKQEGGTWYLYVANGDGTSFNGQDSRAVRVWDIDNLSGKMLRIDPLTGAGVAGNPFYEADDPNSNRSKVVDMGLRNPFRHSTNPTTGAPVVGDVGWNTWEEVNVGFGKNFGWPFYEGGDGTSEGTSYQSLGLPTSPLPLTAAAYAYRHDGPNAIVVGDFYLGGAAEYRNGLFTTDASRGTMDVLFFNAAGTDVISTRRIPGNWQGVVNIVRGPDGNMYYASLANLTEFGGGNDGIIGKLFA
jgi:hypothetical protein